MIPFDLRKWRAFSDAMLVDQVAIHTGSITSPHSLFVALQGRHSHGEEHLQLAAKRGAKYALVRPSCPEVQGLELIRCPDPLAALQEIASLYRDELSTQIVAITGSYGKTVTKNLLLQLLRPTYRVAASPDSFNSQIGVALSLLSLSPTDEMGLIEVGISEPGEMAKLAAMVRPDHAILTSLGDAHIETLGSRERIAQEKEILLQRVPGWVLRPERESWVTMEGLHYRITFPEGSSIEGRFSAHFRHLAETLDRAVQAAHRLGVSPSQIEKSLAEYTPEPVRTEVWRSPLGALFISDGSSDHPLSHEAALRLLPKAGRRLLIGNSAPDPRIDRIISPGDLATLREEHCHDLTVLIKGPRSLNRDIAEGLGSSQLTIHLEAVRQNVERIRGHLPSGTKIMGILKADAYSTGALEMAQFLLRCGVSQFGVAHTHEAIALRQQGIEAPIMVLHLSPREAHQVVQWNLEAAVSDEATLEALSKAGGAALHLHVDTGMTRLGCRPEQAGRLARRIEKDSALQLVGAMTHFAAADDPRHDRFTEEQMVRFIAATGGLDVQWRHGSASSGVARFPHFPGNLVRIGIGFFGSLPSLLCEEALPLVPALSLTSHVAALHDCKPGDTVSYGRKFEVTQPSRIAVVPFGYHDGAQQNGIVLIRGRKAPIVGALCMDFCMIDVTHIEGVEIDDEVLFFGEDAEGRPLPFGEVADHRGVSPSRCLTEVGPRVARVWSYEAQARQHLLHISG